MTAPGDLMLMYGTTMFLVEVLRAGWSPSAAERLAVCHGVEPAVRNRPARSGGR